MNTSDGLCQSATGLAQSKTWRSVQRLRKDHAKDFRMNPDQSQFFWDYPE